MIRPDIVFDSSSILKTFQRQNPVQIKTGHIGDNRCGTGCQEEFVIGKRKRLRVRAMPGYGFPLPIYLFHTMAGSQINSLLFSKNPGRSHHQIIQFPRGIGDIVRHSTRAVGYVRRFFKDDHFTV